MKKWYNAMLIITLALVIGGVAISLTARSDVEMRESISKTLIFCAVMGLVLTLILGPRVKKAEAFLRIGNDGTGEAHSTCTFSDVAANDTALNSLKELRDYLKNPEKYVRYGARMPKGILFYGPPGTGKTLLARALAGEAGVPFFAMSGSDFVEKYVGVGAGRVRDLFKKARKAGKCVIFIDEIDAMGKKRDDQSSDERDQTLNALLSEMSGFYTGDGVLVIAATNRIEMLDPALLRPGRFDRQIEVSLPGKRERLSILKLHARNKPLSEDVDLERIAEQTTLFSGASLENLMNEAAILAAGREGGCITGEDVEKAFYNLVAGADRESAASQDEKCTIALHEAGHALASRLLMPKSRLARVSILPAGNGAAGYNLCIPEERVMLSRQALEDQICVLLAGRAAEVVISGDEALTAGASGDLARATEIASAMVMELGMGGAPAVSLKVLHMACGAGGGAADACRQILDRLYARTCDLLGEHATALITLTKALLESETLTGAEVDALIESVSNERQKPA